MSLYESFSNNLKMNTSHKRSTKRSKELGYKLLESEKIVKNSEENKDLQDLIDFAEEQNWYGEQVEDGIEFSQHSPAGEDFNFFAEGTTVDEICASVFDYAESFDPDEHAEIYVSMRGKSGVPESIRTLIDDADAIKGMLDDFSEALDTKYRGRTTVGEFTKESEASSNKYDYLAHVLNFLNNTAPGGISDGEIRVLADVMYNIDTGKGELPREESTFVVTPEQREEVTAAIETDDLQRFLGVINNIVVDNSEEVIKEAAGPEIPAYLGDPNDDPDWHPESKRDTSEPEVIYFKEKNRPEPTGEIVTSQDLNYPGVAFKAIDGDITLYVTAWWSDNEPFSDEEEKLEWEDPDDVWNINYNVYDKEGNEIDGGLLITYDYDKWSASELCNDLLGLSGYIKDFQVSLISTDEVESLLEESQTQEIGSIVSDMVKSNPKAEKYLDEYLQYINTLEPKNDGYNNDTGKFNDDWEDWYRNTANVLYNPTAWNKFIEWVKEKYGEDAVKGLNESEDLKSFKFKVYTETEISNGKASCLANTVNTLKEAEDLVQSYRKGKLKAHYTVNKD